MSATIKHRFIAKDMSEAEWIKAIKTPPRSLIASNSKLSKSNIYQFSLPAFQAVVVRDGELTPWKTCPSAGACGKFCYASQGTFMFGCSMVAHTRNLQFYLDDSKAFVSRMVEDIGRIRKLRAFRIHDSGDFFSREYALDWFKVIEALPEVQFYAYTKMVPLFNKLKSESKVPSNLSTIYSFGGRFDHLIDVERDRHSKVFGTDDEMRESGYADTSETDDNAADPTVRKIGLVYHGKSNYHGTAIGVAA
jgi:hypothetical protein